MEYAHGGDIYTYKGMLDFSVNVNPLGPSERVIDAAKRRGEGNGIPGQPVRQVKGSAG